MTKLNRSIERGLVVLEAVHVAGSISLAALAARTGLPKPTLLRICASLEAHRWLMRRPSDGCYQFGSAFPAGDGKPNRVDRLVAVGKDALLRLTDDTGLASDLAAAIGGGRLVIVDTTRAFREHGVYPNSVGFRPSPIHSALGAAYLHALPVAERAQALHDLAKRLPREDALALPELTEIFNRITARGYAVRARDHWGRAVDYGALPAAIAVPILAAQGPIGAVNLIWSGGDDTVEGVARKHLARLQAAARAIGQGYGDAV